MPAMLCCYCLGLACISLLPTVLALNQLAWLVVLLAIPGLLIVAVFTKRFRLACLMAFLCGGGWHLYWAQLGLQKQLPPWMEGHDVLLQGQITGLTEQTLTAQRFRFLVGEEVPHVGSRLVVLNYYGDEVIIPGQSWQFLVRLNRPVGMANPATFDYEAWLFSNKISARGYVRQYDQNKLIGETIWSIHRLRHTIQKAILNSSPQAVNLGAILALVLGDRSHLSQQHWNLFSASGTNHLFVISGLHIGLIATFCFFLFDRLLRHSFFISSYIPAQKIASLVALVAAVVYSALAGFSLPTQRALIMTGIFLSGNLINYRVSILNRFLFALAIVLSLDPLAVVNSGFWLSFTAVAALLLSMSNPVNTTPVVESNSFFRWSVLKHFFQAQWIVFLALFPVLLLWIGSASLIAPLVNIFAIPLLALVIVPLCLMAVASLAINNQAHTALIDAADRLLTLLFDFLVIATTSSPLATQLPAYQLSSSVVFVAVLASACILAPRALPLRRYVAVLLLPLILRLCPQANLLRSESLPLPGDFTTHVLDVGQGLATIVQTRHHTLVYDTGARLGPNFDLGAAVVVPVLKHLGINRVDMLVISHADNDHVGGAQSIMTTLSVNEVLASWNWEQSEPPNRLCQQSRGWSWDGVEFRILHPDANWVSQSPNDDSCVLRITGAGGSLLLPGDIEITAEHELSKNRRGQFYSDVVVAPHHGSNTSSSYAFIKQVMPDYVVFAAGYRNSFGHPSPRNVARYQSFGATPLVTSETGMITFNIAAGKDIAVSSYRDSESRYWR